MLEAIRIILVETTHPGNIGAAARAMKNMGLQQLYLVAPKKFPDVEATARAAGADDLLAEAVVVETLEQAVADCTLVIGSSARSRTLPIEILTPRDCCERLLYESGTGEVALVFGRESSGLNNEELLRCNYHVNIPTVADFSSLNLAAAVQVLVYELRQAALSQQNATIKTKKEPLATAAEVELFYQHLQQLLFEIDFLKIGHSRKLMQRLRRLFNRSRLKRTELKILRGILTAVQNKSGTNSR